VHFPISSKQVTVILILDPSAAPRERLIAEGFMIFFKGTDSTLSRFLNGLSASALLWR
jgi:hypothetical protein